MKTQNIRIEATVQTKTAGVRQKVIMDARVLVAEEVYTDGMTREALTEHDLAAILFAIEFAANNSTILPGLRVHISTQD